MTEAYRPEPLDTSDVRLPEDLLELTEQLARHNHDVWARQRIADRWQYGPARDDSTRTHPDLVPYEDLADSEKQYDRNTALEVLKAIVALGYTIGKP